MKEIPIKNYIVLLIIIVLSVVSVFYVRSWYITNKEYYSRNSVIKDVAREINIDEISNYTLESPKFILYVSSGGDLDIKDFENNFKKLIKRLDIEDDIIYLNMDNVYDDIYSRLNSFSKNEKVGSLIINSTSSLYVFEDGNIVGVLNNINNYSDKNIESFMKKWGFIGD